MNSKPAHVKQFPAWPTSLGHLLRDIKFLAMGSEMKSFNSPSLKLIHGNLLITIIKYCNGKNE